MEIRKTKMGIRVTRKFLFALSFFALLSFVGACKKKRDLTKLPYVAALGTFSADAFGVVVTSSLEGYIEPCGCTADPLGGIARFAMIVNDFKLALKNKVALVDAGNLLFDAPTRIEADRCQDEKRIELLLSSLSTLGLKTTVVGPLDNARGVEFREDNLKNHTIKALTPLTSAEDDEPAIYEITTPTTKIGVVAVTAPANNISASMLDAKLKNAKKAGFSTIIALSQMQLAQTKAVFANSTTIDIVMQGQTEAVKPAAPTRLGEHGPWLFENGRQGQYFSMLVFQNMDKRSGALAYDTRGADRLNREGLLLGRVDALQKQLATAPKNRQDFLRDMLNRANNEIAELKKSPLPPLLGDAHFLFHQVPITKKIESDAAAKEKLEDYEKSVPLLVKKCEANIECPKADPKEARYVGVLVCKSCHQEAFDVWNNSIYMAKGTDETGKEFTRAVGHSKAWKTLADGGKDTDRSCIGCHSIGFMEKGGYCKAFEVDFRKDVQCESCHGAGSLHAQSGDKKFIKRNVEEATCRECHQVPHIPSYESFNYEEKLMKVLGKGHGENLLKQLQHRAKS